MKKAILAVLVVFLGFWLYQDPHGLADTAKTAGGHGWDGASQFMSKTISFVQDLTS
jgi:hypothetical protein